MSKPELLYATNNPGKLGEVREYLGDAAEVKSPQDLGLDVHVDESGATLEANAELKARAFAAAAPDGLIVMADDTGLEIDALGGEPGIKVRRWKDGRTEMTDEEIIAYCLERLKDVPPGERGAQFRTVIALLPPDADLEFFDGTLRGEILESAVADRKPGFPFRSLMYVPEADAMLGEEMPPEVETHRQKAVRKAVDWLDGYNK